MCVIVRVPNWLILRFGVVLKWSPFAGQTHLPQKIKSLGAAERQGLSQACPSRSATDLGLGSDLVTMIGHWFFHSEHCGRICVSVFQWPENRSFCVAFWGPQICHLGVSPNIIPGFFNHGSWNAPLDCSKGVYFPWNPWTLNLPSHLQDMYIRRLHCRKGFLLQSPWIWKEAGNLKSTQPDHPVAQDFISFLQVVQ